MNHTNHPTTLAWFLLAAEILACGAGPISGESAAGDSSRPAAAGDSRPDLTVLHTINNAGYIEPCG